jgi:hypothetical protein
VTTKALVLTYVPLLQVRVDSTSFQPAYHFSARLRKSARHLDKREKSMKEAGDEEEEEGREVLRAEASRNGESAEFDSEGERGKMETECGERQYGEDEAEEVVLGARLLASPNFG